MPAVLHYDDLDMACADAMLEENGELLVNLRPPHAKALISFIDTVRTAQSWAPNRVPRIARLLAVLASLTVTTRILLRHSRIFALCRVVVLNSSEQSWQRLADGNFLFRFLKRGGAA